MFVVGVDGCRGGWLAVSLSQDGNPENRIFSDMASLWSAYNRAALILVDIPIGLWEAGPDKRTCDVLARRVLGARKSSVFPAPPRKLLEFHNMMYPVVNTKHRKITGGKGISRQSYALLPKIQQADQLLRTKAEARRVMREVHPEVCFWALAGARPMQFNKKKKRGFDERQQILITVYPPAEKIIAEGLHWIQGPSAAPDDLLDALAAAVTGFIGGTNLKTLPESPERDAQGLPMEMVYYLPPTQT